MLHRIWNWLRQLKTEAPWYFWAYVALTPLNFLIFYQELTILCSLMALGVYVFLLKTFGMLRNPSVYIFAIAAHLLMTTFVFEFFLGKNLHLYFTDIYHPYGYPDIYYIGGSAVCSAAMAAAFALLHRRSFSHALKICITVFFMLVASIGGFPVVLLPFFPC